jgi:hypothetical protein
VIETEREATSHDVTSLFKIFQMFHCNKEIEKRKNTKKIKVDKNNYFFFYFTKITNLLLIVIFFIYSTTDEKIEREKK